MRSELKIAAIILGTQTCEGAARHSLIRGVAEAKSCWTWDRDQGLRSFRLTANLGDLRSPNGTDVRWLLQAILAIDADYTALIPADAALPPGWISYLAAALERNGHPVAMASVLHRFAGVRTSNRFETAPYPVEWAWPAPILKHRGIPAESTPVASNVVEMAGLALCRRTLHALHCAPLGVGVWPLVFIGDTPNGRPIVDPQLQLAVNASFAGRGTPVADVRYRASATTHIIAITRGVVARPAALAAWLFVGTRTNPGWLAWPLTFRNSRRTATWRGASAGRIEGIWSALCPR